MDNYVVTKAWLGAQGACFAGLRWFLARYPGGVATYGQIFQTDCPPDWLFWVRRCAAANPSTPAEVLALLAQDEEATIRWCAAANPSTPAEVLALLAQDDDVVVRWGVAENPSTPARVGLGEVASVRRVTKLDPQSPREWEVNHEG